MSEIHITHGALESDEEYFDQDVLRGRIDQNCLKLLQFDWYQRKQGFSTKEMSELVQKYFQRQKLTDITIGMRGNRYRQDKEVFWLEDKCYVIDGAQRVYAARIAIEKRPDLQLSLGAKIYFNTTSETENTMFCEMNSTQQRVSASVLIRNKYRESDAAKMLYDLFRNNDFVLKHQIGWDQKNMAGEMLTGFALCCIAGALHQHKGAHSSGKAYDVLATIDYAIGKMGDSGSQMQANILKFFDVVDDCWAIRNATKKDRPACLNQGFLSMLARLFSSYHEFWDGADRLEFYMPAKYLKKLKTFDSNKIRQQVSLMARSDVDAKDVLFEVLRQKLGLKPFDRRRSDDISAGATV